VNPKTLPFWNEGKFKEGNSKRAQTFVCASSNKFFLQNLTLKNIEELRLKVVIPMQNELGFQTLRLNETKDHVNLRCEKNCMFYVVYSREPNQSGLNYKRTIFQAHSV
jgi:hypothetical protein